VYEEERLKKKWSEARLKKDHSDLVDYVNSSYLDKEMETSARCPRSIFSKPMFFVVDPFNHTYLPSKNVYKSSNKNLDYSKVFDDALKQILVRGSKNDPEDDMHVL
jgi:hypothetical protein